MSWSTVQKSRGPVVHDCTIALRGNGRFNVSLSKDFMERAGLKSGDKLIVQRGEGPDAGKARFIKGAGGYSVWAKKKGGVLSFTNWTGKPAEPHSATPVVVTIIGAGTLEFRVPDWLIPTPVFEDVKIGPRRVA